MKFSIGDAEGQRVRLCPRRCEAFVIAPQRGDVCEQEMSDEHGLRRAEMSKRRHQRIAGGCRLANKRSHDVCHGALKHRDAPSEI